MKRIPLTDLTTEQLYEVIRLLATTLATRIAAEERLDGLPSAITADRYADTCPDILLRGTRTGPVLAVPAHAGGRTSHHIALTITWGSPE